MKSFPFMVQASASYKLRSGDIIPGKEPGELLKVTSITEIELNGVNVTVFGRCRHLKEGEAGE